jgi:prepilin-type N-terminal cleavage/methylation domain-containing protein
MRVGIVRGFTLLEQVIALAILTIGMISAARLFGESLQQLSMNARHRGAGTHAEDLLSRIAATTERSPHNASFSCTVGIDPCFREAEIEAWLTQWHERLLQQLPGAVPQLTVTSDSQTTTYRISIGWPGRDAQLQTQRFEIVLGS